MQNRLAPVSNRRPRLLRASLSMLAIAALLVGLAGCYTHRITVGNGGNDKRSDSMQFFFINGFFGTADVNVRGICGSNNATGEVRMSLLNMLISGCTSGLLTPTQVTVYCGKDSGRAQQMTLTPDQQLALMHSDAFDAAVEENAPEMLEEFRAARDVAPAPGGDVHGS